MARPGRGTPVPQRRTRRLAALTVAVLAVHLVLLQGAPPTVGPARAPAAQFVTRTLAPLAPPPAAAPVALQAPEEKAPPHAAPAAVRPPLARRAPAPQPGASASVVAQDALAVPPPAAPPAPEQAAPAASAPATPPAAVATTRATALAIPPPMRLHYQVDLRVRGLALAGRASLDWRHDGQQYEARLEVTGPGLPPRVQRSTGRLTAEGLAPGYFSDRSRGEQATHFDREQERIVFSNNRPAAALLAGMQDRLSVILQLSALVAGEPERFTAGTVIALPTASVREAETWVFTVEGEEDLALPGGTVRALKLLRAPRREFDQRIELWLAPRMAYAPVRLRLTNPNGDAVDQGWSSTDKG